MEMLKEQEEDDEKTLCIFLCAADTDVGASGCIV